MSISFHVWFHCIYGTVAALIFPGQFVLLQGVGKKLVESAVAGLHTSVFAFVGCQWVTLLVFGRNNRTSWGKPSFNSIIFPQRQLWSNELRQDAHHDGRRKPCTSVVHVHARYIFHVFT